MARVNGWHCVCLLAVASALLACGRTQIGLTGPSAAGDARPATQSSSDAATIADTRLPWVPDAARFADVASSADAGPDLGPDLRSPNCGNGHLDPGEECDDGNTYAGDGCDSACKLECNFGPCPWPPYVPTVVCGDGVLGRGEACDDGNLVAGDGCSAVCTVEVGFQCIVPGRRCTPICGDGLMVGTETCDDGNEVNGDGCSDLCLVEPCWDCTGGVCVRRLPVVDGGSCMGLPTAGCGDGRLEGAEECDDGHANSDSNYGGCSSHCRYVRCGDGIVNGPEECDLGQTANTAVYGDLNGCTSACTHPHYCGDGYVDSEYGESCDLGSDNGTSEYCTLSCVVWLP